MYRILDGGLSSVIRRKRRRVKMSRGKGSVILKFKPALLTRLNLEATPMKVSEKIYHFITEFIDVRQQFAGGYGYVTETAKKREKKIINYPYF